MRGAEAGRSQGAGRPARRAPAPQTVPGAGVQVNLELAAPNQEAPADQEAEALQNLKVEVPSDLFQDQGLVPAADLGVEVGPGVEADPGVEAGLEVPARVQFKPQNLQAQSKHPGPPPVSQGTGAKVPTGRGFRPRQQRPLVVCFDRFFEKRSASFFEILTNHFQATVALESSSSPKKNDAVKAKVSSQADSGPPEKSKSPAQPPSSPPSSTPESPPSRFCFESHHLILILANAVLRWHAVGQPRRRE